MHSTKPMIYLATDNRYSSCSFSLSVAAMYEKPFSQACENNKLPILAVLQRHFQQVTSVLEIGSGTGQHAVYFSQSLPHLIWQPSDRAGNLAGINRWIAECNHHNLRTALELDVTQLYWPTGFDAVFSANTAHIMSWEIAQEMIVQVGQRLPGNGVFALYGPFNYHGSYTSDSNRQFDEHLKAVHPQQGIRDFEQIDAIAASAGLKLLEDCAMPANNRLLIWKKP
jgi:cyclopropane fatty-acyl-phospholipid synthase-like methyltransferase